MSNLYSKYTYFGHNVRIQATYKELHTENKYNYRLYTILVQAPAPGPAAPVKFRPRYITTHDLFGIRPNIRYWAYSVQVQPFSDNREFVILKFATYFLLLTAILHMYTLVLKHREKQGRIVVFYMCLLSTYTNTQIMTRE